MSENNFNSSANSDTVTSLKCPDVVEHLGDFLEKDLSTSMHSAMEKHFSECSECAALNASYQHVVASAAKLRTPEKSLEVDVQNRLRGALNKRLGINLSYIA